MRTRTTRSLSRRLVAAGLLLFGAVLGAAGLLAKRMGEGAIEYAPPRGLPRLKADTIRLPATASLLDFAGDTADLYFLDGIPRNIVHLSREPSGWQLHGVHGKPGAGPGELRGPRTLALWADTVLAVSDMDEIELFSRAGTYLRTIRPPLPCPALMLQVASAGGTLFGAANCVRGDTMAATLFRIDDARDAMPLTDEPRTSLSGRWGSMFVALRSIGDDAGGVTFGTGRTPCVVRQAAKTAKPGRECWPLTPYRADPPAGFTTERPSRNAWPDTLPYYVDRVGSPSGRVFLLRPFSADSGVIVAADENGGRPLMVVPLSAMIGCRAPGCAWTAEAPDETLVLLVSLATLDSLAAER